MASWHKRARLGVAIFGVAVAGIVYFAMGERQAAAPLAPIKRADPKSIAQTDVGSLLPFRGLKKDFEVFFDRSQLYEDGSTKMFNVTIVVHKGDNRTFTVKATEAWAGKEQIELELTGDVKLEDSDGFFLTTDKATYHRKESIARASGAVTFGKGRMNGSGVGITYDDANSILTIAEQAHVTTSDEAGKPVMEFTSGAATLDRVQHLLTLDTSVHVVRGEQVIDTDHAVSHLSENDDIVTFIELRGNSRVEGGDSAIDAMSARDIDLDYTDDGERLEAVGLKGGAAAAMTATNGSGQQIVAEQADLTLAPDGSNRMLLNGGGAITMVGEKGTEGRRIASESLELDVAADGSLTRAVGRENVRLDLPAAQGVPMRNIRATGLDGSGEAGKGLTSATFTGDVTFAEGGAAPRIARAQTLQAALANDAVTSATFTGDVTFEETGLKACAARLDYQPDKGTLALSGATGTINPMVAEEQITIEAQTIDVALDGRRMMAKGSVTTQMHAATRCKPATQRTAAEQGATRMPGLLKQDAAATITAGMLAYQGASGQAVYSGRAALIQGDTAIHADTLSLDQKNGDLTATGDAVSSLILDGEGITGRAHEIRYVDKTRQITHAPPPAGVVAPAAASRGAAPPAAGRGAVPPAAGRGAAPPAAGRGAAAVTESRIVGGALGDLRAGWIDVLLAADAATVEKIVARTNVTVALGLRTVTGGATLEYDPAEAKYVVAGSGSTLVRLIDRTATPCRESSGRSVTFYKADDRIEIDGKSQNRAQVAAGACSPVTR